MVRVENQTCINSFLSAVVAALSTHELANGMKSYSATARIAAEPTYAASPPTLAVGQPNVNLPLRVSCEVGSTSAEISELPRRPRVHLGRRWGSVWLGKSAFEATVALADASFGPLAECSRSHRLVLLTRRNAGSTETGFRIFLPEL